MPFDGSIRETAPSPESATHTEPAPVVSADADPVSRVATEIRSAAALTATTPLAPRASRGRGLAAPGLRTKPPTIAATASTTAPAPVRRRRDPTAVKKERGAP